MKTLATMQAWERYADALDSADANRADAVEAARLDLAGDLLQRAADEARAMLRSFEEQDLKAAACSLGTIRFIATEHAAVMSMPAGTRCEEVCVEEQGAAVGGERCPYCHADLES